MNKFYLMVLLSIISNGLIAQRQTVNQFNSWFVYNGDHHINAKWGVHAEVQLRRNKFVSNPMQFMTRLGLNYDLNKTNFVSLGYLYAYTDAYGEQPSKAAFPEHRIWEQFQSKNQQGIFELVNRLRLEQRYVHAPVLSGTTYAASDAVFTNRARFSTKVSIPLKGKSIADKSFYVVAQDEVFVNFGKNVKLNVLDQNRAYLGFGYKLPKLGRLELGYVKQTILKSDGIKVENNNTLQFGMFANFDWHRVEVKEVK